MNRLNKFNMKKTLLIIVLFFGTLYSYSQDIITSYKTYCLIVGTGNLTGTKVKVEVDFGEKNNYWTMYKDKFLVDESGEKIDFNSMVDAMNFMGKLGWKFEQAYVITVATAFMKQNVYHYLLSKDITHDEQIKDGLKTMQDMPKKEKKKIVDDLYR